MLLDCVIFEMFICSYLQSATKKLATTRQSIYATAVCDSQNDNNHSAAVCVKDG